MRGSEKSREQRRLDNYRAKPAQNNPDGYPDERASPVPSEKMLLPRKLTAENGAKYALIGEFYEEIEITTEDGDEIIQRVPVSWTTIKAIWDRAVIHFEALDKQEREGKVAALKGSRTWWVPESVRVWLFGGAATGGR